MICIQSLARKGIKDDRMKTWTSSSPDLNPIENVSSVREDNLTSVNMIWEVVVPDLVDRRLEAVSEKKGGNISLNSSMLVIN